MNTRQKQRRRNEVIVTACLFMLLTIALELTGVTPAFAGLFAPWLGTSFEAKSAVAGFFAPFVGVAIYGTVRAVSNRMNRSR